MKTKHTLRSLADSKEANRPIVPPGRSFEIGYVSKPFQLRAPSRAVQESLPWKYIWFGLQVAPDSDLRPATLRSMARGSANFAKWLGTVPEAELNNADVLGRYSNHLIVERNLGSTGWTLSLIQVLRVCLFDSSDYISQDERRHISSCIDGASVVRGSGAARSLCDWFLDISWLRAEMQSKGLENIYLKLESPKIVCNSIKTCYATLLSEIQRFRKKCLMTKSPSRSEIDFDYASTTSTLSPVQARTQIIDQLNWFRPVLSSLGDSDPALGFFFCTRYGANAQIALDRYKGCSEKALRARYYLDGCKELAAQSGRIFGRCHLVIPSDFEQLMILQLFSLCCIQPAQASTLTLKNLLIAKNSLGSAVAIQIRYRKRRARGHILETELIPAKSLVGRVLIQYHELVESAQEYLPESDRDFLTPRFAARGQSIKLGDPKIGGSRNLPNLLAYCLRQPSTYDAICDALKKQSVSRVFVEAFLTLMFSCDATAAKFRRASREGKPVLPRKVLPEMFWGTQSLKQLGVYARSDQYRVGDLVNYNSHTSETERLYYLNDRNKDWVNRNGRITRIVIDDLHQNVFQPNREQIRKKALDKALRTDVVAASEDAIRDNEVLLNSVCPFDLTQKPRPVGTDFDHFVVIDHPTTVVYMLHFLDQSERHSKSLARLVPDFLEQTVAPKCEWIEILLTEKISPDSVRDGQRTYSKIRDSLPPLFTSKLRG